MMNKYLFNDILEERSYLEWRDGIDELNKEYDDRFYYGQGEFCHSNAIRCQQCDSSLWNWRPYGCENTSINYVFHKKFHGKICYNWRALNIHLPKNY